MISVTGPSFTKFTFIMLPKTHAIGERKRGDTDENQ